MNKATLNHEVAFSFNPPIHSCGPDCYKTSLEVFYEVALKGQRISVWKCPNCGRTVMGRPAFRPVVIDGGLRPEVRGKV